MRNQGIKLKEIANHFNISTPTVWKILKFRTEEPVTQQIKRLG